MTTRNPLSALNIMLIENQAKTVTKVKKLLSDPNLRYPHQVKIRVFDSFTDAKPLIGGGAWDAIILSLDLPDTSGFTTFQKVFSVASSPIIVIVYNFSFDLKTQLLDAGAARCLSVERMDRDPELLPDNVDDVVREARKDKTITSLVSTLMAQLRTLVRECPGCNRWKHEVSEKYMTPSEYLQSFDIFLNSTSSLCPACSDIYYGKVIKGEAKRLLEKAEKEREDQKAERPRRKQNEPKAKA